MGIMGILGLMGILGIRLNRLIRPIWLISYQCASSQLWPSPQSATNGTLIW